MAVLQHGHLFETVGAVLDFDVHVSFCAPVFAIDWENFETAITKTFKSSKTDFSRYIKFMIDMENTGAQKENFTSKSSTAPTASNKCPCCKTDIEITMNIYSCSHKQVKTSLKSSLETLFQTLQSLQIPLPVWLTIRADHL